MRGDPQDGCAGDAEGSAAGEINEVMIGSRPLSLVGCTKSCSAARPAL
jgi:hypothetical protein